MAGEVHGPVPRTGRQRRMADKLAGAVVVPGAWCERRVARELHGPAAPRTGRVDGEL